MQRRSGGVGPGKTQPVLSSTSCDPHSMEKVRRIPENLPGFLRSSLGIREISPNSLQGQKLGCLGETLMCRMSTLGVPQSGVDDGEFVHSQMKTHPNRCPSETGYRRAKNRKGPRARPLRRSKGEKRLLPNRSLTRSLTFEVSELVVFETICEVSFN